MSTDPENGEETAGCEAELAADLAALKVNVEQKDARQEEETAAAAEDPGDITDGWTPPPREECPVCFLPLPLDKSQFMHKSCCGKRICCGCHTDTCRASKEVNRADYPCPFCRTPAPNSEKELIARLEERIEKNDPTAMLLLGDLHVRGDGGLPKDVRKGWELVRRAAELGLPAAYATLGACCLYGQFLERDLKEAGRFLKIAADKGDFNARLELGRLEEERGNIPAAVKHYKISASAGDQDAVDALKDGYKNGHISKEEFAASLRAFQDAKDEMKSEARERARVLRSRRS